MDRAERSVEPKFVQGSMDGSRCAICAMDFPNDKNHFTKYYCNPSWRRNYMTRLVVNLDTNLYNPRNRITDLRRRNSSMEQ